MYSIVGLEEPPGSQSIEAKAINNLGQVVGGASLSPYPHNRAYLWSEGVPQDLGELLFGTIETDLERPINNAYGINSSGQVVGASGLHAFLWDASTGVQDLGTLPGDQNSVASTINDSGRVAGRSGSRAFLWSESTGMQDLGTLPDDLRSQANANAINDSGQVAGESGSRAFLWSESTGMQDLGTLPANEGWTVYAHAFAINDSGQVVGQSSHHHAFLWSESTGMQDLGILPLPDDSESRANAVNNSGQVVGESFSHRHVATEERSHAFVWSESTGMQNLSDLLSPNSGWALLHYAMDINDSGQILARGVHTGPDNVQKTRLCVLTPS